MSFQQYSAPRNPRVVEKRLPTIREHELLIKVKACGVCGTDLHIHEGGFGAQFPVVPGHETVGVVAAFGSKVKGFSVGDRVVADNSELCGECFYCRRGAELFCENFIAHGVMVDGGFAEYAAYPARRVFPIKAISDVDATLIEPAACAAHGIDKIAPHVGSNVLLFGAAAPGGVKMAFAKSLDAADEYIDLPQDQTAAAVVLEKLQQDNPYGFDIVVEATGSAKVLERALDFVRKGGKLVVYGVYKDDDRIALAPNKIFKEEIHVSFRVEEWEECLEAMRTKRVIKAAIIFD
ncbi:chaperonin 10-like protein [Aspergillus tetrazonus]